MQIGVRGGVFLLNGLVFDGWNDDELNLVLIMNGISGVLPWDLTGSS